MQTVYNWLNGTTDNKVKTVDDVKAKTTELKVEVKVFAVNSETMILLNYEDDAPRTDEFVLGCRGTIWYLNAQVSHWFAVRATMNRFFNYGENGSPNLPNLTEVQFEEKEDGSLVILYFNPLSKKWFWGTRNTTDISTISVSGKRNLKDILDNIDIGNLMDVVDPTISYMFELCTPFSTVVIQHPISKLVFLSARSTQTNMPGSFPEVSFDNLPAQIQRPRTYQFGTIEECRTFINSRDPTKFEGMVLKFGNLAQPSRIKVKSEQFVSLAHTSKTDTPPPEQVIMAILKKDLPELLATHSGKWDTMANKIADKLDEFRRKIKITDDALVIVPPNPPMSKKDEAEIIKKSVCPAYHFARSKFANLDAYLLKQDPMQILRMIGADSILV